jgi:apolipoprotein N-acyltransferase
MLRNFVRGLAEEIQTDIFTGFPHYEVAPKDYPEKFKFFNSATKITKEGKFKPIYRKNILVPFGERIPFLSIFPILWKLDFGQANWEYGTEQNIYYANEHSFSPLICFEIAFDGLAKKIVDKNTDFIVNLTNDAWFHRSAGTYQHLMMTKFRAIETRKQIYRAANTGFSAIVSPKGEILKQTELFEKKIISEQLYIYNGNSFFTKYMFWFPLVFVGGAVLMIVFSFYKRRSTLKKI